MATLSIHTNPGAIVAQASFRKINNQLDIVSKRVNTGYRVADAKDDASTFAVAQGIRGEVKAKQAVATSLSGAVGVTETALSAGESISTLVGDIKAKLVQLGDDTLTATQRGTYQEDLQSLVNQVVSTINQSTFNGINVLSTSADATFLSDTTGGTLNVRGQDLLSIATAFDTAIGSSGASITGSTVVASLQTTTGAFSVLETGVNRALGQLGADNRSVTLTQEFITQSIDALENGLGALVDADLAKDSSRLQALQAQQQLAVQAISIANAAPNALLSLFG